MYARPVLERGWSQPLGLPRFFGQVPSLFLAFFYFLCWAQQRMCSEGGRGRVSIATDCHRQPFLFLSLSLSLSIYNLLWSSCCFRRATVGRALGVAQPECRLKAN